MAAADVKRSLAATDIKEDHSPAKLARLGDDRVAAMPVGSNLIEIGGKSCTHEVCWPPGAEGHSLLPPEPRKGLPAREYPFSLDPFQQTAINALEAGHSVLVAAHTSAGKTVVAEYAFAMGLRDHMRVVYTSPIKALSNQKYRELAEAFGDVGLMTGDVVINPNATCLVMTTEILRSMLYKGSEVVREVGLLVYDEVHYLRDAERGVVWEESIILAPKGCRMAFLSATIPNTTEFASWVAATHGSPVHVVYTEYRPTPLQHYLFPAGADGLFMVVDERGVFRDDNFQAAVAALQEAGAAAASRQAGGKGASGKGSRGQAKSGPGSDIFKLVMMVMKRGYDPFIVFSFSKKECENLALSLSGLDLNNQDEKQLVEGVFKNAIDVLSEEDQRLPQIGALLPMLKRGIGVHHSGLLPILKEVVELLFHEGLLKVLFATETFSTGLNMPAKTVAFTRARKWDGGAFRWLRSGEYIQMSGRAGRRGLDDRGIVILMFDTQMEPSIARDMIKGAADPLVSAFQLRYSQLLQLARTEGTTPEMLLQASFRQWQLRNNLPQLEARVAELAAERDLVTVPQQDQATSFYELLESRLHLLEALRGAVSDPAAALRFLQPGRLVCVDSLPPDANRQLPSLGQYCAPPAVAGGDTVHNNRGAAAAAADSSGCGSEVLSRVDTRVWGVLVSFEKAGKHRAAADGDQQLSAAATGDGSDDDTTAAGSSRGATGPRFVIDVLLNVDPITLSAAAGGTDRFRGASGMLPRLLAPKAAGGVAVVVSLPLEHLSAISAVRLKVLKDLRTTGARTAALAAAAEVLSRYAAAGAASEKGGGNCGQPPLLDPQQDMQLTSKDVSRTVSRLESVESRLQSHPLWASPNLLPALVALQHKNGLTAAAKHAKRELKAAQGLVLQDELKCRMRVLRRLGYLDGGGLVTAKGRVAAELSSGHDELVLAELLMGGAFSDLATDQLVALCSCFVWSEKSDGGAKLKENLSGPLAALRKAAAVVATAAADAKMAVSVQDFVDRFRPELMEACSAWARGSRFADVLMMTPDVFEGSLVRAVRRAEELMRQVAGALRGVGDHELAGKFDDACAKVKRDIIFAASLYL